MKKVTTTGKTLSGTVAITGSGFFAWFVGKAVEVGDITFLNDAVSISMLSWLVGITVTPVINLIALWIAKQTTQLSEPTFTYPENTSEETSDL